MKDEVFEELLQSVREGGSILRNKLLPSRRFEEPDVRKVRASYRLSQPKFAALMGISPATLRNWEQGRREPEGSARVLLRVVARHPEAVLDVVAADGGIRRSPSRKPSKRRAARAAKIGTAAKHR
jgi:putative transcriptional regulator